MDDTSPDSPLLFDRGPTPGCTGLVLAYARHLRLRIGRVVRRGGRLAIAPADGSPVEDLA